MEIKDLIKKKTQHLFFPPGTTPLPAAFCMVLYLTCVRINTIMYELCYSEIFLKWTTSGPQKVCKWKYLFMKITFQRIWPESCILGTKSLHTLWCVRLREISLYYIMYWIRKGDNQLSFWTPVYPRGSYVINVRGPSVVCGPSIFKYLRDRSLFFSETLHEVRSQ